MQSSQMLRLRMYHSRDNKIFPLSEKIVFHQINETVIDDTREIFFSGEKDARVEGSRKAVENFHQIPLSPSAFYAFASSSASYLVNG